jgi:hypothetical protein
MRSKDQTHPTDRIAKSDQERVYPKLLATLTEADQVSQFRLAPAERAWAGAAARQGPIDGCIVDPAEGIPEHWSSKECPKPRSAFTKAKHPDSTLRLELRAGEWVLCPRLKPLKDRHLFPASRQRPEWWFYRRLLSMIKDVIIPNKRW